MADWNTWYNKIGEVKKSENRATALPSFTNIDRFNVQDQTVNRFNSQLNLAGRNMQSGGWSTDVRILDDEEDSSGSSGTTGGTVTRTQTSAGGKKGRFGIIGRLAGGLLRGARKILR